MGTKSKNSLLPCTTDQNKQQSEGENAKLKERTCGPERPIVTDWALVGPSPLGRTRRSLYGLTRLTPSRWASETPSTWQPVSLSAVLYERDLAKVEGRISVLHRTEKSRQRCCAFIYLYSMRLIVQGLFRKFLKIYLKS